VGRDSIFVLLPSEKKQTKHQGRTTLPIVDPVTDKEGAGIITEISI